MLRVNKLIDYGTVLMAYLAQHCIMLCQASTITAQNYTVPIVSKLLTKINSSRLTNFCQRDGWRMIVFAISNLRNTDN